jgi:nucleotide-binding universal stress UspA family protein
VAAITHVQPAEREIDEQEAATARQIAEEGAAAARRRGYNASAQIAQASESVARTIDEIAQEIDAGLIVCGQRGRGAIGSALLGSVSNARAAHTKRPVLIAPHHPS